MTLVFRALTQRTLSPRLLLLQLRLELQPLPVELSFEKGLFVVVRAIQLLTAHQPGKARPTHKHAHTRKDPNNNTRTLPPFSP